MLEIIFMKDGALRIFGLTCPALSKLPEISSVSATVSCLLPLTTKHARPVTGTAGGLPLCRGGEAVDAP